MKIELLVNDPDKKFVEIQLVKFFLSIANFFPLPQEVTPDELLYVLTELINSEDINQINTYLSEIVSYTTAEGEYAVILLKCALQNKININKSQEQSLEKEIKHHKKIIAENLSQAEVKSSNDVLGMLEKSWDAVMQIKKSVHFTLIFETILYESRLLKEIKEVNDLPDHSAFKNNKREIFQQMFDLLESFRQNQIPLNELILLLQSHYRKSKIIPHASYIGSAIGFFTGKLTASSQLVYDYLQVVIKTNDRINERKKPIAKRPGVPS
jgi:hypothetical protein